MCGMTNEKDALIARNNGADMIGIIFANKSKRLVSIQQAINITNALGVHGHQYIEIEDYNNQLIDGNIVGSKGNDYLYVDSYTQSALLYTHSLPHSLFLSLSIVWFLHGQRTLQSVLNNCKAHGRPAIVGVFVEQNVEQINHIALSGNVFIQSNHY